MHLVLSPFTSSPISLVLLCKENLRCAETKSYVADTTVLQHCGSVLYYAVSSVCSAISDKYNATIPNVTEFVEMNDDVLQWIGQIPPNSPK